MAEGQAIMVLTHESGTHGWVDGHRFEDYCRGLVPLIVPLTLIRHHVRRFEVPYLRGQVYLEPRPKELMLRNHV